MKKRVALVTGGYSGEATISYKSAEAVSKHIDLNKYELYKIDIHPEGWDYIDDEGVRTAVNKSDFTINASGKKIAFDVALMCIHGTPGEDGKLQGYFDLLGLPYTTCNAATSALTFNKRYTVAVAGFGGIKVARSVLLFREAGYKEQEILSRLKLPLFVKPNNGGSSIGMSKVTDAGQLGAAIEKAFKEDGQVLIEEFIEGREFTIGVFKQKNVVTPLPITEIVSKKEFFDYEAKYLGMSDEITPAKVDESIAEKIRNCARLIYNELNCRGVVRIDFIYNEKDGEPYMLEVNTVPGQSDASIVPQQVQAMGWTLKRFYTELIEEALSASVS